MTRSSRTESFRALKTMSFPQALDLGAVASGVALVLMSLVVLGTWLFLPRYDTAEQVSWVPMSPNTAIGQGLVGLGLVFLALRRKAPGTGILVWIAAAIAGLLGGITLFDNVAGHVLAIDHWIAAPRFMTCPRGVGHMSPMTAALLTISGASLIALAARRPRYAAIGGMIVQSTGWIVLTGYCAGAPLLYGGDVVPMALSTSCGFLLAGHGLLFAGGLEVWPLRMFAGRSSRAILLRTTLPPLLMLAFVVEILMGLLLDQSGPLRAYGMAALIIATAFAIFFVIQRANEGAARRLESLQREHDQLTEKVRVRQKYEAIGRLAGGVAHEINNPLAIVMNCTDLVTDAVAPDSPEARNLREIQEACERIAAVVKGLLVFSQREDGHPSPARPRDLLDRMIGLARRETDPAGIRLVVEVEPDLPSFVCRSGQVSLVLLNLIVHLRESLQVVRDAPRDRQITIAATRIRRDGRDCIRFAIEGTGSPDGGEPSAQVFEPFQDPGATHGSRLGLWVAAGITRDHGGELTCLRQPDGRIAWTADFPTTWSGEPG